MHVLQKRILSLARANQLNGKNLRQIADSVDETHLQKIKHHLNALLNKNLLRLNSQGQYRVVEAKSDNQNSSFVNLPIYGSANCGVAQLYTTDSIEGHIQVSKALLPQTGLQQLIVLRAVGDSMNKAQINGVNINHGDYLIIDIKNKNPQDGDYVLSVIDNMANIKRYFLDQQQQEIRLVSESTRSITPIIAKQGDDFLINGKVIKVIKA